jgi:hypothetical protein
LDEIHCHDQEAPCGISVETAARSLVPARVAIIR